MAATCILEIVTPVRQVLRLPVESVTLPGVLGELTVLPHHLPLLTALTVGSLSYRRQGERHYAFVAGGFADVTRARVLVLAEVAELPAEIDIARALRAGERARERLESRRREEFDFHRAHAALQRSISRIKVHQEAGLGGGASIGRVR